MNGGSIPSLGKRFLIFSKASRLAVGPTLCPTGLVRGAVFPGVRWPWPWADHSCQSSAEVNAWISTHPSYTCMLNTVQLYFYCYKFSLLAGLFAFGGKEPFMQTASRSVWFAVSYQIWAVNPDIDSVIVAWPCFYFCSPLLIVIVWGLYLDQYCGSCVLKVRPPAPKATVKCCTIN